MELKCFCLRLSERYISSCIGNAIWFLLIESGSSFLIFFYGAKVCTWAFCGLLFFILFCWNLTKYFKVLRSGLDYETIKIDSNGITLYNNGFYSSILWKRIRKITFMIDRSGRVGSLVLAIYVNKNDMRKFPLGDYSFMYNPFRLKRILTKYMGEKKIEKKYRLFEAYI